MKIIDVDMIVLSVICIIGAIGLVLAMYNAMEQNELCAKNGGVLVRGAFSGFECIKKVK